MNWRFPERPGNGRGLPRFARNDGHYSSLRLPRPCGPRNDGGFVIAPHLSSLRGAAFSREELATWRDVAISRGAVNCHGLRPRNDSPSVIAMIATAFQASQ